MPEIIATIFHISDLHLHVDADGRVRTEETMLGRLRERLEERGLSLPGGLLWHEEMALAGLKRELPLRLELEQELLGPEGVVVVVQTGDVEALGGLSDDSDLSWQEAFPSWAHLEGLDNDCPAQWIHVFGNHDTWPATVPLLAGTGHDVNADRIGEVDLLGDDWRELVSISTPSGVPLIFARVNTVARSPLRATLASASLGALPPELCDPPTLLEQMRQALEPWAGMEAVRIALMHHPPHAFASSLVSRLGPARFPGAGDLAQVLADSRVQLVLAGHRHHLDPPEGQERYGFTQRPLQEPTVQLVAETAAQRLPHGSEDEPLDSPGRSFCRYRLLKDGGSMAVERTVFGYHGGRFRPGRAEITFDQLPLA